MRKELEHLETAVERLVRIIRSRQSSEIRSAAAGLEISGSAQRVLRCVIEGGPLRVSEIARATNSGDPAVSRILSQLEADGLLERRPDPEDGRATRIHATRRGAAISRRLRRASDEIFETRLSRWTKSDAEKLASRLDRLCLDLSDKSLDRGRP